MSDPLDWNAETIAEFRCDRSHSLGHNSNRSSQIGPGRQPLFEGLRTRC